VFPDEESLVLSLQQPIVSFVGASLLTLRGSFVSSAQNICRHQPPELSGSLVIYEVVS
jgi:hypothetical protein